jgi:hypothetical protein
LIDVNSSLSNKDMNPFFKSVHHLHRQAITRFTGGPQPR